MNYTRIYTFEIMDFINAGKTVCAVDRGELVTFCVGDLTVKEFSSMLKNAETEKGRYDFWIEEAEEKQE